MVRYFKANQIGISTAVWKPKYWTYGQNKQGSVTGIEEKSLSPSYIEQFCSHECTYKALVPHCPFINAYTEYLNTVDFNNYLLPEFKRIAEEVRKINNYEGEPEIILLVYETPDNPCSERQPLIDYFNRHGIEVTEYQKFIV
jgi:hypothetical protein